MEGDASKEAYNMTSNNSSNPGWLDTSTSKLLATYRSFDQLSSTSSAILPGTKQLGSTQSAPTLAPSTSPLHSTETDGELASGFVGPDAVSKMSLTSRMPPFEGQATEWLSTTSASIKHISSSFSTPFFAPTNSTAWEATPLVSTSAETSTVSLLPSEGTTWPSWTTDGPPGHHAGHQAGPEPLGLLALLIVTFLANILVCLAVRFDKRLHTMTYYFFMSLSIVHLLMLATIMPPAVFVLIAGSFNFSEEWCKVWVTLDLFFCNNTCLHLAFTNMDTFLRLKDPLRHGRILTTCSVVLWIGAPWMISFVQAIAQFMLSQGDHGIIHSGICYIADKNFVILGTLFSFLIPTVISVLFYIMCVFEIRSLKGGKFLDDSEASTHNIYRYASNESVGEDDGSDTTSCVSETETLPREQVQLAVVTNMKSAEIKESITRSPTHSIEETTTFCDEPGPENTATSFADHILSTDQSASCTLLLRDAPHDDGENCLIRPNAEDDHDSPDEQLRHEQAISRLMFVHLLLTISLWIPFSASNVVYGVCPSCRDHMTFKQSMTFKWLAYSTAVIGPFLYGKFCDMVRDAYWRVVLCRYCCQRKRR